VLTNLCIRPLPAHAHFLQQRYGSQSNVHIFETALGDENRIATLHVARDYEGNEHDYYHSLVKFDDTPTIAWAEGVDVECRTLDSLVVDGSIPRSVES